MSSWFLLRSLLVAPQPLRNAIYHREKRYPPLWHIVPQTVRNTLSTLVAVLFLIYLASVVYKPGFFAIAYFCLPFLFLLLPSLLPWAIPLSLALAPPIARERERGTWDTLRISPIAIETLLLEKAAAALWGIRHLVRRLTLILGITSIAVGVLGALAAYQLRLSLPESTPSVLYIAMIAGGMILYLVDRAQQFALMCIAALAASSSSLSIRNAILSATVATLLTWLLDAALAVLALSLPAAHLTSTGFRFLSAILFTFGPTGVYLTELHPGMALLAVIATLLLREMLLRLLWRYTLWSAER